jgi:hypothetical protein
MNKVGRVKQQAGLAISRSLSSVLMGLTEIILGSSLGIPAPGNRLRHQSPTREGASFEPAVIRNGHPQRIADRSDMSDLRLQFCSLVLTLYMIPLLRKKEALFSAGSR